MFKFNETSFAECHITSTVIFRIFDFFQLQQDAQTLIQSHVNLCQWVRDLIPADIQCLQGWQFQCLLGVGISGLVLGIVREDDPDRVSAAKIMARELVPGSDRSTASIELQNQEAFQRIGLAPRVLGHGQFKLAHSATREYDVIVMDRIQGTLKGWIQKYLGNPAITDEGINRAASDVTRQIQQLLHKLKDHNYTHGDMHWANLVISHDNTNNATYTRLSLLDFGRSLTQASFSRWDTVMSLVYIALPAAVERMGSIGLRVVPFFR